MPPRVVLPLILSRGFFTTAEAAAAGVGRGRLRGSDIAHPFHGMNSLGVDPDDLVERCEALTPLLGRDQWFSHLTAARLWGMPLPTLWHRAELIHTVSLAGATRMQRAGVVGWHTADADLPRSMLGLLPVVSPATVWAQLSMPGTLTIREDFAKGRPIRRVALSPEWLVAVADFLVSGPRASRRRPLCTEVDLRRALIAHRGKRGAAALAWALERARHPVDSPRETLLRLRLVEYGLPEPAVQPAVMTAAGWRHADLGYPDARLLLEYQGDEHRTNRGRWLEDLTRIQLFQDAGYEVIAVGDADITPDCSALAGRVCRSLARRFAGG